MIRNSVGSHLFRTVYALVDGEKKDILRDGELSCAFFVSSILSHFKLIGSVHAGVEGLRKDMEASGWRKTDMVIPGVVIAWGPLIQASGESHPHIGFALDETTAVSSSYVENTIVAHPNTETPGNSGRAIHATYTHPFLEGK